MAKSALTIHLEYGALRGASALVNALPYGAAMKLAAGLGWFLTRVCRFKRRRTLGRIAAVFPGMPRAQQLTIATRSLINLLQNAVEMMRSASFDQAWMDAHIIEGRRYKDKLQSYVDEGHGVVILVPHSGNWYMAAWSMAKYGLPLCSIAARQRNPKLEAWMNAQYRDIEVFDRDDRATLAKIKNALQSGRAFAMLPDLRVRRKDVEAPFLGGTANVSRAGAMFAVKCGCPIVVAMMRRVHGRHQFNHLATLRPDPNGGREEPARLTREVMKILSDEVMKHPEDWFWYNKRWILEPVAD